MQDKEKESTETGNAITRRTSLIFKGRYAKKGRIFFIVEAVDPKRKRKYTRSIELDSTYEVSKEIPATETEDAKIITARLRLSDGHKNAIFEELEGFLLNDMGLAPSNV